MMSDPRGAELGEPVRVIEVEPLYNPVPAKPEPAPAVEPEREPQEVPA